MYDPRDPRTRPEESKINCDVCSKEIPHSEAESHEADEYVIWFCGLECYEQWRKEQTADNAEKPL